MTPAPVNPGDVLAGKYRVERVLGRGGMGIVVLATHIQLEERIALKFLRAEALEDADLMSRFTREARLAVKLKSEHVAKVMDVGMLESGSPYIVMEYLEGEDLNQIIKRSGPMQVAEVAEYVIQACDGIAEAHAMGIVHRDLKPANMFLTRRPDGTPLVKVLDFGISKSTALNNTGLALTKSETVLGSPYYMSPEQMKSSKDVDARSDVWSLGVILYRLLTARLPFEADTLGGLMAKVLQEDPVTLEVHRPDVPAQLRAIVARCLQRDRSQRASSVAEVALALAPYAPPRAHPIAERIASLLGTGTGHTTVLGGGAPSVPVLSTSQGLSTSQTAPKKGGAMIALMVGAALGVVGGLALGAWLLFGSNHDATIRADEATAPSASLAVLPSATASAVVPQATPAAPSAPPASVPAAAGGRASGASTKTATAPAARSVAPASPAAPTTQTKKGILDDRN